MILRHFVLDFFKKVQTIEVKNGGFLLKKVLFINSILPFKKPKIVVISDLLIFQKAKKRFHDLKIKGKRVGIREESKKVKVWSPERHFIVV